MRTPHVSAVHWRKTSRSDSSGGACVEVSSLARLWAAQWQKSSCSDSPVGDVWRLLP
ncbi:DUF397 domain-containing protein [Actinomadura livida]|uniref:DUF397 domain-containing protein n=1 Tax=Actinomadura livida TaxID=79909 RepID=UPI001612A518